MTNREIFEKLEKHGFWASIQRYYDGKEPKYCLGLIKDCPKGTIERTFDFNNEFDLKISLKESMALSRQEIAEWDGIEREISRRNLEFEEEVYKILFKK